MNIHAMFDFKCFSVLKDEEFKTFVYMFTKGIG